MNVRFQPKPATPVKLKDRAEVEQNCSTAQEQSPMSFWLSHLLLLTVLGAVSSLCTPDPALPARIQSAQPSTLLCAGFLDPTQAPYSAAGNGAKDDSDALQSALDDAYKYRMTVRLPAGSRFLVTRQANTTMPSPLLIN